jgi:proteasome lid subunit RPN8/RPN11
VLEDVLLATAPEEGCALLLGQQLGDVLAIEAVWPCLNVWVEGWPGATDDDADPCPEPGSAEEPGSAAAASRRNRFAIDPREQLLAQKWARLRGIQVIGSAHSHPDGAAIPSALDRAGVLLPTLMVIRSAWPGPNGGLGAWWLPESPGEPRRLNLDGDGESGRAGDLGE